MTDENMIALQGGRKIVAPEEFRCALLGSTVVPDLGMTFAEAGEKWRALKAEADQLFKSDVEGIPWDDLDAQRDVITKAVLKASPQTARDALVALDILANHVPGLLLVPDQDEVEPAFKAVNSILSSAPALLSSACELSPAIVSAYWSVRRMAEVHAFMQEWQRDLREGTREESAFTGFVEAASDLRDHLLTACYSTPAASIADHLLKVRVSLDIERSNALGALDSAAREGLEAIVRSVPFPAAPVLNDLPAPTADEEARAFLTAHPEQIPNASPADLLRLFTPDEGAEVFAILAGYVAAKRGAPDKLPKAIASLRAYGEHLAEGFNPYAEVYRCAPGIALSEDERASLGRLGYLSAAAIKRLDRWTRRTKAKREEQNKIAEAVEKARRELQERERYGPPLAELLLSFMPDSSDEVREAAASLLYHVDSIALRRILLREDAEKLTHAELQALRRVDFTALPKRLIKEAQDTFRQELTFLDRERCGDDAELLAAYAEEVPLLEAVAEYYRLRSVMEEWPGEDDPPKNVSIEHTRLAEQVARLPASTIQGVVAKLRVFFLEADGYAIEKEGVLYDYLRTALEGAERAAAAARSCVEPQPDPFADTVTEFANEGTASLALPGAPTDAMVIAGAKAAGCSPEDLRRGYDAMVAAYAQERAA